MTEKAIPMLVDVTPQKGRRVRTQDGSLLPENHILRGEPRSSYWLRLERDKDVKLTAHQPATEVKPAEEAVEADPPPPAPPTGSSAGKPKG